MLSKEFVEGFFDKVKVKGGKVLCFVDFYMVVVVFDGVKIYCVCFSGFCG